MLDATTKTAQSTTPEISAPIGLVVAFAAELARQGRHAKAERLLLSLPNEVVTPSVLDLLARVYAQLGRYSDAEAQWTNAIQLDPSNEEYLACLKAAERLRSSGAPWHRSPLWRLGAAIALTAIVVFVMLVRKRPWSQPSTNNGSHEVRVPPPVEHPKPNLPNFHLSRATVRRTGTALEIEFDDGLFSRGTRFSKAGKERLREIAGQIRSQGSGLRLELRGRTDPQRVRWDSRFRDNSHLALARAEQAALFLHQMSGLPLSRISISTAFDGLESEPPIPHSLPIRSRRTVTIRVLIAED